MAHATHAVYVTGGSGAGEVALDGGLGVGRERDAAVLPAEAEVKPQRTNVLRLLEKRCQAPVPKDLAAAIQATQDMSLLLRWFDAAAEANTFDEFRAATQPSP